MKTAPATTWIALGIAVLAGLASGLWLLSDQGPPARDSLEALPPPPAPGPGVGQPSDSGGMASGPLATTPWQDRPTPPPSAGPPDDPLESLSAEEAIKLLTAWQHLTRPLIVRAFLKSESDQPLINRAVSLRWRPGSRGNAGPWDLRTKTDSQGFIEVELPSQLQRSLRAGGPRELVIAGAPEQGALIWSTTKTFLPAAAPRDGEPHDLGTFHLQMPGVLASGRVLNEKGEAIPGASLEVRHMRLRYLHGEPKRYPPVPNMETRTDGEGRYELRGQLCGGDYLLFAVRPGYAQPKVKVLGRKSDIRMVKGAALKGRLLIPQGLDARDISVRLRGPCVPPLYSGRPQADGVGAMNVPTDPDLGAFSLSGLLPGNGTLSVSIEKHGAVLSIPLKLSAGLNTIESAATELTVSSINSELDLRATLYPAIFTVRNEQGEALAGATLRAIAERASGRSSELVVVTNDEGRGAMTLSPKLPLTIIASHPSCSTRTFHSVRNGLEMVLFAGIPIALRINGVGSVPKALSLHVVAIPGSPPGQRIAGQEAMLERARLTGSVARLPRGAVIAPITEEQAKLYLAHEGSWEIQLWASLGGAPPSPLRDPSLGRFTVSKDGEPLALTLDASGAIESSLGMTASKLRRLRWSRKRKGLRPIERPWKSGQK